MKVNEASWDRVVRIILGAVLLYLGWAGVVGGTLGVIFQWLGFVPLITGIIGWCPLYSIFKVRTNKA